MKAEPGFGASEKWIAEYIDDRSFHCRFDNKELHLLHKMNPDILGIMGEGAQILQILVLCHLEVVLVHGKPLIRVLA